MSRYIDADATRDLLIRRISLTNGIDTALKDAPSIDIVRCKDCKHRYDDGWLEPRWTCDFLKDMRLKDDDFCSYGERKNDEGHN